MKDEEAIDYKEGFPQLLLDKDNKLKKGSWKAWEIKKKLSCVFLGEEENECVKG
jgi:hypothetical protein